MIKRRTRVNADKAVEKLDIEIYCFHKEQLERADRHFNKKLFNALQNSSFITYGMLQLIKKREETYARLPNPKVE